MTEPDDGTTFDPCPRCEHDFNQHPMVATTGNPMDGGVVICQHKACDCYATWGVENAPPKFVPSEFELTAIRAQVQT